MLLVYIVHVQNPDNIYTWVIVRRRVLKKEARERYKEKEGACLDESRT